MSESEFYQRTLGARIMDWILRTEFQDEERALLRIEIARREEALRLQKARIAAREFRHNKVNGLASFKYTFTSSDKLTDYFAIIEFVESGKERGFKAIQIYKGSSKSFSATNAVDKEILYELFRGSDVYINHIRPWVCYKITTEQFVEVMKQYKDFKDYSII